MKTLTIALMLVALAGSANIGAAYESVNLSWNGCTGPTNRTVLPGEIVSMYASVIGHSEPHRAYQFRIVYGTGAGPPADAWRFDGGSCQGTSRLTWVHVAPPEVAATCPTFHGTLATLQIEDRTYDSNNGLSTFYFAVAYPNGGLGNRTEVDPAQRYFLARWQFDHSNSVNGGGTPGQTCGGVGQPTCIALIGLSTHPASWVDTDGVERPWAFANMFVTANDHIGCPGLYPDPAVNTTWGQIKGQYR